MLPVLALDADNAAQQQRETETDEDRFGVDHSMLLRARNILLQCAAKEPSATPVPGPSRVWLARTLRPRTSALFRRHAAERGGGTRRIVRYGYLAARRCCSEPRSAEQTAASSEMPAISQNERCSPFMKSASTESGTPAVTPAKIWNITR